MKTVKEYLMELPPDVRELAINNTDENLLNTPTDSAEAALTGAFVWLITDQGNDFWADVFKNHFGSSVEDHFTKPQAS